MLRLILLLMGGKLLRRHWQFLIAVSVLSLLLGLIYITDRFNSKEIIITTDLIGLALMIRRSAVAAAALVPVAIGAALINAALETAGMSFLPLYAMRLGWSQEPATLLLSVLLFGAILLQLPIGWLGDQMDWRKLVVGLGLASVVGALVWPFIFSVPFAAYSLLFVWGGLFVGIYTIMMSVIGSNFRGGDLVSVYSLLSVAWGIGAFLGPSSAGAAMDLTRHGLPIFAAIACTLFTGVALLSRRKA